MPTLVSTERESERTLLTADEFLDWPEPGVGADPIDGQRFMHSPVTPQHALLVGVLDLLMKLHVERERLGEVLIVSRTIPGFFVERAWLDPAAFPSLETAAAAIRDG